MPAPHPPLDLPALEIRPVTMDVGTIHWQLRPARRAEVLSSDRFSLSSRTSVPRYSLADGETVIEAGRRKFSRPDEADGVLWRNGHTAWQGHRQREGVEARIAAGEWAALLGEVRASWKDAFRYTAEVSDALGKVLRSGLRPPQLGALHAVAAHWSLHHQAATVVMPTGTGKTEAMLAALVSQVSGTLLVVVPSRALRDQTARKFRTLGLLHELGNLPPAALRPIVGVVERRPRSAADWDICDRCNVLVATIGTVAQGAAADYLDVLASKCTHLFIDEAHHVAADTWDALRERFAARHVVQFTATPFRRDGRPVDGKVIYSYPLNRAQQDGYFKRIHFTPVFQIDAEEGDRQVARRAVEQLRKDLRAGRDHLLLARCKSIERARKVHGIYQSLAPDLAPVLVHSESSDCREAIERLRSRASKAVVCVDMLGEGFDLPQLKVAAVHDTHKSLAVLLQFVGRFTRSGGAKIGEATVVANVANQDVSSALERLYSEDSDWNRLLSEYSSEAVSEHLALAEFLRKCSELAAAGREDGSATVSPKALSPKFSAVVYRCPTFSPKRFHEGLEGAPFVHSAWLNEEARVIFFITRSETRVAWSRARTLRDNTWDLYVVYHDPRQKLLYVHSSNRETLHQNLASAVGGDRAELLSGDVVFRCLGGITRLVFQNVGLKRHGRRNLRYSMYSGTDVATALGPTQTANSTKSNVFGSGFAGGGPATIGCSYKGRIWSREQGSIQRFVAWCDAIGAKLNDPGIDTQKIIENVLVPKEIETLPDRQVLCLDWPREMLDRPEEQMQLNSTHGDVPLSQYGIEFVSADRPANEITFRVVHDTHQGAFALRLGGAAGFEVRHVSGEAFTLKSGKIVVPLEEWFSDYPPSVLHVDGSELDGCLLIEPTTSAVHPFPPQRVTSWAWAGTDLRKESMWKDGTHRTDSIQHRVYQEQLPLGFDVLFDDDSAGEAADLVCMKEEADHVRLRLIHCKFSGGADAGERVKDVVEVCSQAVRSSRWIWRFADLCKHLLTREANLKRKGTSTRLLCGDAPKVGHLAKASRFKPVRAEILVVQPGLSAANITEDQAMVLNAAHAYLMETVGVGLDVIGSP